MDQAKHTSSNDRYPPPAHQDIGDHAVRGIKFLGLRQILVGLIAITGIISLPLLLSPSDFSPYGYVNLIILLGAAVGDLGLGASLIKRETSNQQLRGMLGLQLLFWLSCAGILMAFALAFDPFGFSTLTYLLLCGGLVFFALQALPIALMEKRLAFRQISMLEVLQRGILIMLALGLAIFEPAEWVIPFAGLVAAVTLYPVFMRVAGWRGGPLLIRGEPLFRGFASEWWQTRIANQLSYASVPLLGGLLLTTSEVGLLIWAMSISLIPGYFAPMAARALYPAMAQASAREREELHKWTLKALLFFGAPLVVFLFLIAPAGIELIFAPLWEKAVPSVRILLLSSVIGIGLSTALPHLFLTSELRTTKQLCFVSTGLIYVLGLILNSWVGIEAIPVAILSSNLLLWFGFALLLRTLTHFDSLKVAAPAYVGLIIALAVALPVSQHFNDTPWLIVPIALGAVVLQISISYRLGGGISSRRLRQEFTLLRT